MQDENSASQSPKSTVRSVDADDLVGGDDLGKFVGDTSFSDVTSDDSSGWMHKIDVTNFQRLTSTSSADAAANLQELAPVATYLVTETTETKDVIKFEEDEHRLRYQFAYSSSTASVLPKQEAPAASSRPYSRHYVVGSKLSPPQKKSRQRDSSTTRQHFLENPKPEKGEQQPQISVVSSSSDASRHGPNRQYPKPVYSYSCMIALALKNSQTGRLQVAEIYCFMCENYPYFRTAPAGWKNSVRHNLSLNKCFEKVEVEAPGGHGRKCCLWALNPQKVTKMDQEIRKYREKDPVGVREAYARPEDMELVELGLKGIPNRANAYHGFGRAPLPDLQQIAVDVQHPFESQMSPFMAVDTTTGIGISETNVQSGYVGVGKSELALKLLQQAASYGQSQWNRHLSMGHPANEVSTGAAISWPSSQLENNRSRCTPNSVDQCPLEFSPIHCQSIRPLSSPPPYSFSTPIRRSSTAACYSPFSRAQTDTQRPSSLHQFQSDSASMWRQPNSPTLFDARPLPVITSQHRTPERPISCGYTFDGMIGGNNNSLLVTPTSESLHHRGATFGTSLESAFCAATTHNNSLIMQSVQQQLLQSDDQLRHPEGLHPLAFHSIDNPPDNGLHLTSL